MKNNVLSSSFAFIKFLEADDRADAWERQCRVGKRSVAALALDSLEWHRHAPAISSRRTISLCCG